MTAGGSDVVWWLGRGPSASQFTELFIDPWNARQDHVHVRVESLEADARDRTVAAMDAGGGPDLAMIPRAGDFVSLARRGLFLDLTPYAERHDWARVCSRPRCTWRRWIVGCSGCPGASRPCSSSGTRLCSLHRGRCAS